MWQAEDVLIESRVSERTRPYKCLYKTIEKLLKYHIHAGSLYYGISIHFKLDCGVGNCVRQAIGTERSTRWAIGVLSQNF